MQRRHLVKFLYTGGGSFLIVASLLILTTGLPLLLLHTIIGN